MKLIFGIIIATLMWFLMFAEFTEIGDLIHNNYFWIAMSASTLILSIYSLINNKKDFKQLFKIDRKLIYIGILHAIVLYLLSRFGVLIAKEIFSDVVPYIESVYETRTQLNPVIIGFLLAFLIGPAEEIFWRGFVQKNFESKFSKRKALYLTTFIYAFVHIWALNPMLLLAATILGIHWGYLYMKFNSLTPGLVSHAIWDTLIFVILPINF